MRKLLGVFTALALLVPVVAVASPRAELEARVAALEEAVADLSARVAVLEGTSDTTTTSTTELPSSTSTTSSTSTSSTTTTTTEPPASTTTTEATTTSTSPVTTTTTGESQTFNLTADWLISDDLTLSNFHVEGNGHAIFIDGANVSWSDFTINNVERVMWHGACGVSTLTSGENANSGGPNLGEYPFHWHLCGDSTRGTVVDGVTVLNGANHAFVPHGSHGITIRNSVARNIHKEAFWWDPPGTTDCDDHTRRSCTADNSNDSLWEGNLVDNSFCPDFLTSCRGNSAFLLNAGSGNRAINNLAINTEGGVACTGYEWNELSNNNFGGTAWEFRGNKAFDDDCSGIDVWQNDGSVHVIEDFESDGLIGHGAYTNFYEYHDVDVPAIVVHAVNWSVFDSEVGEIILRSHRSDGDVVFTNVTGSKVTVADASVDSNQSPINLIINGTNLGCGDVDWVNPHPETRVIIDGEEC